MRRSRLVVTLALLLCACTTSTASVPTPTATEFVAIASPTATEVPTETPTETPTATPEPTATQSPTPEPTAVEAPVPVPTGPTDLSVVCTTSCWPLTGKPLDGNAAVRPIALRYDNALPAQPQAGINQADIVFDTLIESCVSRLLAVFQSRSAGNVGAVRSARLYDLQLLPMLRGVLAHVGAADEVSQMIRDATARGDFVDIDAYKFLNYPAYTSSYFRINWKVAPYNLYSTSANLRAAANSAPGGAAAVNVPNWGFLPSVDHDPTAGGFAASASGTRVGFPGNNGAACPDGQTIPGFLDAYAPTYVYDVAARGYRRYANGQLAVDETTGVAVLARNVVVIESDLSVTNIIESQGSWGISYSIMPRTTGTGKLLVYRDGRVGSGTWSRSDNFAPFTFTSDSGERVLLSPGQTWVHIIPSYWTLR